METNESTTKNLQGQVGIVTGGGRGIGRAIAQGLAADGMAVAVAARSRGELDETVSAITGSGGRAIAVVTDVTDQSSADNLVAATVTAFGHVDLLVNNAGSFAAIGPVWDVDPEVWWRDVTTNLFGSFLCARAVLPHMIDRGRGRIINMSGGGSVAPFEYGSGYACSKAALLRLTDTLAREAAPYGVGVFAMGPGLVRTAMTEFQLESDEGKRWFTRAADWFRDGIDVPPTEAARVAAFIAALPDNLLAGRVLSPAEDLSQVLENADRIIDEDLYTLRLRKLEDLPAKSAI